jgi:two-component system alkaline phosphatase synthesis response regulator PhoP
MKRKILAVDDEAEILELLAFNLEAEGYEVFTADTGWVAINQARAFLPDLIILDLMLPEMDGFTVCEVLQKLPSTARVPVVMLTAWSSELSRIIGLQAGAKDYVTKPFSPRELIFRVKAILSDDNGLKPQKKSKTVAKVKL